LAQAGKKPGSVLDFDLFIYQYSSTDPDPFHVDGLKYQTFFMLAIMSGARQGELIGLKWSDVDWFNSQLIILMNTINQESAKRLDSMIFNQMKFESNLQKS